MTVAVVDIGKTNAKLLRLDDSGAVAWSAERANTPYEGGIVRALDAEAIEAWLIKTLAAMPGRETIETIVPVAHGGALALLDTDGDLLIAPDYEDTSFEDTQATYRTLRDPFAITRSPALPVGLNLGAQLFHIEARDPALFARVAHILPWPQYWAWRLSGVMASEVTSLGSHSDLWEPAAGDFAPLAKRRGWDRRFPSLRRAGDSMGTIRPAIARVTGLSPDCRILCGLHDSNASYLRHLLARRGTPFVSISSGTWCIVMAHGAPLERLIEARDMLANIDAFGDPVPTARFMGGREYAAIAGADPPAPTLDDAARAMASGALALPCFAAGGGPFQGRPGRLERANGLDPGGLAALASLYIALLTDVVLALLGATGDVLVDGPLARNEVYLAALGGLPSAPAVIAEDARSGPAIAAWALAKGAMPSPARSAARPALGRDWLTYRERWARAVGER